LAESGVEWQRRTREALIRLHAAELESKKRDEVWLKALQEAAKTIRRLG